MAAIFSTFSLAKFANLNAVLSRIMSPPYEIMNGLPDISDYLDLTDPQQLDFFLRSSQEDFDRFVARVHAQHAPQPQPSAEAQRREEVATGTPIMTEGLQPARQSLASPELTAAGAVQYAEIRSVPANAEPAVSASAAVQQLFATQASGRQSGYPPYRPLYQNIEHARQALRKVSWCPPSNDDTLAACQQNPQHWVGHIYAAIVDTSNNEGASSERDLALFKRRHYKTEYIHSMSWSLYDACIALHTVGSTLDSSRDLAKLRSEDRDLGCSQRLEKLCILLSLYKTAARDAMKPELHQRLVNAPLVIAALKTMHKLGNDRKRDNIKRLRAMSGMPDVTPTASPSQTSTPHTPSEQRSHRLVSPPLAPARLAGGMLLSPLSPESPTATAQNRLRAQSATPIQRQNELTTGHQRGPNSSLGQPQHGYDNRRGDPRPWPIMSPALISRLEGRSD